MTIPRVVAYVACMYSREVLVFDLNVETGELTEIQSMPVSGAALPMALSPDRRCLYVGLRTEPYTVASLAIDPSTGKLTHIADAPAAGSMPYICADRTGRYLFGVTSPWHGPKIRPSLISVSPIDADGGVRAPQQIMDTRRKAHCVLIAPSNRHVYATSCDEHVIVCRTFDEKNGTLSAEIATFPVDGEGGPRHMVFSPNGRFLYLLNETDGAIYTFAYDERSGKLDRLYKNAVRSPVPAPAKVSAADIHVTANGKFLYASERYSNTLAAFAIDTDSGALSPVGSYATDRQPRGFNIDPLGRYVLCVGRMSDGMTVYAINQQSGALTVATERPVGLGPPARGYFDVPPMRDGERGLRGPNWVEFVSI